MGRYCIGSFCGSILFVKIISLIIYLLIQRKDSFLVDSSWEKPKTSKEWKKIFIKYHDKIDNWFEQLGLQKSESDIIFTLDSIERGKAKMKTFFKNFHSKNSLRNGVPLKRYVLHIDWPQDFIKIILNLLIAEKHIKKAMGLLFNIFF